MSLDAIYMPLPAGSRGKRVEPLGAWTEAPPRTPAQLAVLRRMRLLQIGKSKAANRVQR